jgi:ATP-dependent helicase/nuclease subunit B
MQLSHLISALQNGETVITPTNRLQRELIWNFAKSQAQKVLIQPQCYSYESFLKNWLNELSFQNPRAISKTLLSPWQFYLLWKKISNQLSSRPFNHFEIKQCISAYKNCALALSPPTGSDFLYTPAAELFQKTTQAIEDELEQHLWIAPAKLADELIEHPYPLPCTKMTWAFFDCFHPQQAQLQNHLEQLGIKQEIFDFPTHLNPDSPHQVFAANDETEELEQIIQWVKDCQRNGKKRIGVVVPDFSQNAAFLQKRLRLDLPQQDLHFSLGLPLYHFPIIKHALSLLSIDPNTNLTKPLCKVLLFSPFINAHTNRQELFNQAFFQEPEIPYAIFAKHCQEAMPFLKDLQAFPEKASPNEWIMFFAKRLEVFGFPGIIPLEEETHQVLNKFYDCIEQFQTASPILPLMSRDEAFSYLQKNCQEQIHQPPQNYHGIHIMGWLEASGFCGDALWICHFQSHLVPDSPSLSPVLPIHWQKEHALARTQRDKEFEMGQRMLNRFIHAHPEMPLVISYAQKVKQEPLWPSPLLPHWKAFSPRIIEQCEPKIEAFEQSYSIPYSKEQSIPKGGYQILASLAKCPFQAFANYRLKTKELPKEDIGFNPSERGRIIHRTLQYIWSELKDQNTLIQKSQEEIDLLCLNAIEKSLEEFSQDRPYSMDALLIDLEKQQLLANLQPVLEFDKNRPHFKIKGLEETLELEIDGWPFKLRYDRLDELDNGALLMIDYKSSVPSPLPWHDERPIHPQILMYALSHANIHYLLFLGIKPQEFKTSGFGAQNIDLPNMKVSKPKWVEMQQTWLVVLQTLITEFKAGICTPTPVSLQICEHCPNRDLCRKEIM